MRKTKKYQRLATVNNRYDRLVVILNDALEQASTGKGHERHDTGDAFEEQPIVKVQKWLGTNHFSIGQAVKKAIESTRLDADAAKREILGAIVYLAAAIEVLG